MKNVNGAISVCAAVTVAAFAVAVAAAGRAYWSFR